MIFNYLCLWHYIYNINSNNNFHPLKNNFFPLGRLGWAKTKIMIRLIQIILVLTFTVFQSLNVQSPTPLEPFHKVTISPHIETIFVKGDTESIEILDNKVSMDKVNIEVNNGKLEVYLDDAKMTTKQKKVKKNGYKVKTPIYKGKILTIKVTYVQIDKMDLRGEQNTVCESLLEADEFKLSIYGESEVIFNEINFIDFDINIYGESELTINKGKTVNQSITAYGESIINMVDVNNEISKVKAYGETVVKINSSKSIKFNAYGEAELYYKGNAAVNKGLSFGESEIHKIK
jgi:hypothetical protein